MARGQPRKDTLQLTCRINVNTLELLKSTNPTLCTRDPSSGAIKFRHGALGRYVERLILEDVNARKNIPATSQPLAPEDRKILDLIEARAPADASGGNSS